MTAIPRSKSFQTRMHSSRMRTGRSLTVFQSLQPGGCTWSWGVYLVRGGVPGPGGCVPGPGGCTWSRGAVPGPRGGVPGPGGGVPGPGGCTWSQGGVPGPRGVPGPGGCTWSRGGVPGPKGGYLVPGGIWSWGVYLVPRGVYLVRYSPPPPPVNRMTNRCKNITLAKTSFRPVINICFCIS